jgi:hypothetical protein
MAGDAKDLEVGDIATVIFREINKGIYNRAV